MIVEERALSLITSKKTLESLHTFEKFPVFIGSTNTDKSEDLFFDMHWDICKDSGMIQLRKLLDPNLIYSQYHSEAVGGVWKDHHNFFSDFVSKFCNDQILEIGGSNAYIADQIFDKKKNLASYTIIEPNPKCHSKNDINLIKDFFSKEIVERSNFSFNTVIHSHTFEHSYNPFNFLEGINLVLSEGDQHIFSVPNLEYYLKNKFTNTLNFEHTFYLTEKITEYLLKRFNFEILEKEYFENHSIFYYSKKLKNGINANIRLENDFEQNKGDFLNFINSYKEDIEDLNKKIDRYKGEIYLFGGHIFSQFLLSFGLKGEKIKYILDNSEAKKGQRLYGTDKLILSPEEIKDKEKVTIILKAGQYQDEIKNQLFSLNPNVRIWE